MKTILITSALLALAGTPTAFADREGTEGHGGIDVMLPDGSSQPIEAYLELHSEHRASVCELVKENDGLGDPAEWSDKLNNVASRLFKKLPAAGVMLSQAFRAADYYFLDFTEGARIGYTNDDGSFVEAKKFNGAIRVGKDIYLLRDTWNGYWLNRNSRFEYANMLTRVVHEALLSRYSRWEKDKFLLGQAVIEILRLAGEFEDRGRPEEFSRQDALGVMAYLETRGLEPLTQGFTAGELAGRLNNDYTISIPVYGEAIKTEKARRYMYESRAYSRLKREADGFMSAVKNAKLDGRLKDGSFTLRTLDDLNELSAFLKAMGSVTYEIREIPDDKDGNIGGTIVTKYKPSPQIAAWIKALSGEGPLPCAKQAKKQGVK